MTALFGDQPIIVAGTTDTGRRWAQFWGEGKIAGITATLCYVSMDDADTGTRAFQIHHGCPPEWGQLAWDTYQLFEAGQMPEPTHTVQWVFGKPEFAAAPSPTGGTE